MAKDTRGLPKNEVTKKDIANKQEASDAKIVAQAKDMSSEQIQAGNEARLKDMPSSSGPVKDSPVAPDPLTPKPTIEEITPGKEARAAARNVGTALPQRTTVLDFGKLPSRSEGSSKGAEVNVTSKPDVAINLIDRLKSGMGLPGEEQGHLDRAVQLHEADREVAARTGKTVNGIQPDDPKATPLSVFGGHHHRLAKVMGTFGISDQEVYRNAASASGQRLETYVHGLHKIAQEHQDSKRQITHTPKEGDLWEHPGTKQLHPIAANHPDMPMAFTRTKGQVARVTRGPGGEEVIKRGHEGWDSVKVAGGKTVYRQSTAPVGVDLVDHLRVQMLSEHGPSTSSRKRGADIASQIADTVSGKVPKGMVQAGTRKTGKRAAPTIIQKPGRNGSVSYGMRPNTVETTVPVFVPKPEVGRKADKRPNPPKARTGTVLKGIVDLDVSVPVKRKTKTPAENMQENLATRQVEEQTLSKDASGKITRTVKKKTVGAKTPPIQLTLPGTGEPKIASTMVSGPVSKQWQGPLTEGQASDLDLSLPLPKVPKGSAAEQLMETGEPPTYNPASYAAKRQKERVERNKGLTEESIRRVVVEPAKYKTSVVPTDRDWKRQNPNVGQQFSGIDTTDMTGAEEVKALSKARAFVHQQPSPSREMVVRPGGKAQAKRDRKKPAPAAPEQLSLFPDYSVKEGRSNAFYMAGSVEPISEASKSLQAQAKKPLGSKEVEPVVSGSRSEKKLNDQINKA